VFSSSFPMGREGKMLGKYYVESYVTNFTNVVGYGNAHVQGFWRLGPFFQEQYHVRNGMQKLAYVRSFMVLTFYIFFMPLPSPIRGVVAPLTRCDHTISGTIHCTKCDPWTSSVSKRMTFENSKITDKRAPHQRRRKQSECVCVCTS